MVIESCYWKEDLLKYAKSFQPKKNPPRWTERHLVNFEKELILSMFMVRMLAERHKFSSQTLGLSLNIFRSPCVKKVHFRNQYSIDEIYDLEKEEPVSKDAIFISNQLIHSGAIFAYRNNDRNWGGVHVCSDYERQKYIYRIPLTEIIKLLETAANDYPHEMKMIYCDKKEDYIITTN